MQKVLITARVDYIESTEKYRIDVCIAEIEKIDQNAFRVYPFCLIILLGEYFRAFLQYPHTKFVRHVDK